MILKKVCSHRLPVILSHTHRKHTHFCTLGSTHSFEDLHSFIIVSIHTRNHLSHNHENAVHHHLNFDPRTYCLGSNQRTKECTFLRWWAISCMYPLFLSPSSQVTSHNRSVKTCLHHDFRLRPLEKEKKRCQTNTRILKVSTETEDAAPMSSMIPVERPQVSALCSKLSACALRHTMTSPIRALRASILFGLLSVMDVLNRWRNEDGSVGGIGGKGSRQERDGGL